MLQWLKGWYRHIGNKFWKEPFEPNKSLYASALLVRYMAILLLRSTPKCACRLPSEEWYVILSLNKPIKNQGEMKRIIIASFVLFALSSFTLHNRNIAPVLIIGESSHDFEQLNEDYAQLLLTACGNDMNQAFGEWKGLFVSFEHYARAEGVSLDGVKLWVKVYWSAEGKMDHIAFDLKPQSRKVSRSQLVKLFEGFIHTYRDVEVCVGASAAYSHYGSIAFPVHQSRLLAD